MKNTTQNQHAVTLNAVLKLLGQALKSIFQSPTNREFQRLKDFIAS
ncbi:MAG TPA: hypothetical protein VHL77_01845 [Ferruginibacter sp.]|jgi:hypothetical protein|nr:hypothetical protein [Ferruginibacter sp.]